MKITEKIFNQLQAGETFACGIAENNPDGLYMTNTQQDKLLLWIAVKGHGDDWSIYTHWLQNGFIYVKTQGDKIIDKIHILRCVDCDDEVLAKYRL